MFLIEAACFRIKCIVLEVIPVIHYNKGYLDLSVSMYINSLCSVL